MVGENVLVKYFDGLNNLESAIVKELRTNKPIKWMSA